MYRCPICDGPNCICSEIDDRPLHERQHFAQQIETMCRVREAGNDAKVNISSGEDAHYYEEVCS